MSLPSRECGLKLQGAAAVPLPQKSPPTREHGLKRGYLAFWYTLVHFLSTSLSLFLALNAPALCAPFASYFVVFDLSNQFFKFV